MPTKHTACKNGIKALLICVVFALMVMHPAELLTAARITLETWWNSVLPALLPFFILSELMSRSGINKCLSIWLEPVMRPLFRLPGSAALAVVVGFVAGSPAGAMITADLRRNNQITREEGERLLAFTNNAGPFFILSVTAGSVLGAPELGIILLLSHYPVNLLLGLLLRFIAPKTVTKCSASNGECFAAGLKEIAAGPTEPFAAVLTACIRKSLQTIGIIACYMMICSLIAVLLKTLGISRLITAALVPFLQHTGINHLTADAISTGILEMSIGIAALPESGTTLIDMTMAAALILGFNGFSVQAQVAAMLSGTDIRMTKYLLCRFVHALAAPLIVFTLWQTKTPAAAFWQSTGVKVLNLSTPSVMMLIFYALLILISMALLGLILDAKIIHRENR